MKKASILILSLIMLFICNPYSVAGETVERSPRLTDISFSNASIDGGFSSEKLEYTITLDNAVLTPTVTNYKIQGNANLSTVYNLDEKKHQTGVSVILSYDENTLVYNFLYSNADYNSNSNLLTDIKCEMGLVYPEVNEKTTAYKLYIPNDLEEINISPITKEVGAYWELPSSITLGPEQEPILSLNVFSADGNSKKYTLKVKRLSKNTAQIKEELEENSYKSIIESELLHNKPEFKYTIAGIVCAIVLLALILFIKGKSKTQKGG